MKSTSNDRGSYDIIGSGTKSRLGFTLLELMIAMTILGLALTVIMQVISAGTGLGQDVHRTTEAILLSRWKINEMQIEGFPALGTRAGTFDDPFSDYSWETDVEQTDDENLRELHLRVKWREGLVDKDVELATMLYNYGERRRGLFF